jgi:ferredoxin
MMKLMIKDFCIRCQICHTLYPELYELDFEGDVMRVKVDEVPEELTEAAKSSIRDCAVAAIFVQKS